MKTLTMREFFDSSATTKSFQPGQSILVTSNGRPELIVTKTGQRPRKTAVALRREARALLTKPGKKVDAVALLRELRK